MQFELPAELKVEGFWRSETTSPTTAPGVARVPPEAQAIQIDHVVPLAEAWVSGASAWSPRRRLRYANDLGDLVAASGPVNASKGSSDPAAWRPRKPYQCAYAARWIAIKHRWRLAVDPSEVAALEEMLGACAT